MISFAEAKVNYLQIHKVGNKFRGEELLLSDNPIDLKNNNNLEVALCKYFFSSFNSNQLFRFSHETDLNLNELYTFSKEVFNHNKTIVNQSVNIAKHLFKASSHPKINEGDLFVAYIESLIYNGKYFNGLGLFKSEYKDTYLKVKNEKRLFEITTDNGVNINKLDKGCIIINDNKEEGFLISLVDNINKGDEAQYWKDNFLGVSVVNNEFHQTNQFLGITKQFITKQLDEDFELSKADKIDLLNRSVDYFKKHETFDKNEFEEEVFGESKVIESFRKSDHTYRQENEVELSDNFAISEQAVKKQARVFKSVLKLDKNFHIYIHGNKELIEQGIDENGRKYYKIYYENEA